MNDPIELLVEHAAVPAEALPEGVLAFQRKRLLDHIACRIAGQGQPSVISIRQLAHRWSGTGEATDPVTGERLAMPAVALIGAVAARSLDYCDVISPGWHPSSSDVPVALAVGEYTGASGGEVLAALAVGQDIGQRINLAAQANGFFYRGFDSNVLGLFSGAVIAGRLLGLRGAKLRHAIGIAYDYGIGTFQHYLDRALSVRLCQGLVARAAVEAALMAEAGLTGPGRILSGDNGFFNHYAPAQPECERMTEGLGERYLGEEATCFKLYPCCGQLLALSDVVLEALATGKLAQGEVRGGSLRLSPAMYMVCGGAYQPGATAEIDAQFSARYVAASVLLRGRATLTEFTPAAAVDPAVQALATRFEVAEESSFTRFDECALRFDTPRGPVELSAKFGRGWPENPATDEDLLHKLGQCIAFSGKRNLQGGAMHLGALVGRFGSTATVASLVRQISQQASGC